MLKRIVAKVKRIRSRIWDSFTRKPDVTVSGLRPEEKVFKESINEECLRALAKIRKRLPDARLSIYVKSSAQGNERRFEIMGSMSLLGGDLHASASDRELYSALARVLYEFQEEARRVKGFEKVMRK